MVAGMARLSRFVTVAVLLGGATVSLSACTGGSDPIASPSPSVSTAVTPSPSVSPSPTPLTDDELLALIPEDARGEDFLSASNFAKFFVDLYPELFVEKPDTALFDFLSTDGCVFCDGALRDSAETVAASAHSEGGVFTFDDSLGQGGLRDDGFTYVGRRFSVTDTVTYLADGSEYRTVPGGKGIVALKTKFEDGVWRVYEAEFKYDDV
jgi:hypothetical protein